MVSGKFAITLHILTLLTKHPSVYLSSEFIAESLNMNSVLVRKEIANLKKNGLVESREGKNGGSRLAKAPSDITLEDIFVITFERITLGFSKNKPNETCVVGRQINQNLENLYDDLNNKLSKQLSEISLRNFSDTFS